MKKLLAVLLLCIPSFAIVPIVGNQVDQGTTLPTTCNVGQVYFLTQVQGGNIVGLYSCNAANTWTLAGGSITGTGTTNFIPLWTNTTVLGNSHMDDGVTTAATITSTEPIAVTGSGAAIVQTGVAAPGSPGAGKGSIFYDSTMLRWRDYSLGAGPFTFGHWGCTTTGCLAYASSTVDSGLNREAYLTGNSTTPAFLQEDASGNPSFVQLSAVNPQTGTYQVLASDFSSYKTITVASGTFTITLVASGSQPANGQYINVVNYGSGVVTIARSGQNINGAAGNFTLNAGSATAPTSTTITSDGSNYFAAIDEGTVGTVTSVTFTGDGVVDSSTPSTAVTSSGTLTATIKTQNAQTVLAGPSAWAASAAAPTFRALTPRDFPTALLSCAILDNAICTSAVDGSGNPNSVSLNAGASPTVTVSGGTTNLVYFVNGTYQVVNSNLTSGTINKGSDGTHPVANYIYMALDTANANPVAADVLFTTAAPVIQPEPAPTCPTSPQGVALSSTNPSHWFDMSKNAWQICTSNGGAYSSAANPPTYLAVVGVDNTGASLGIAHWPYRLNPYKTFNSFGNASTAATTVQSGTTTINGLTQYASLEVLGGSLTHGAMGTGNVNNNGVWVYSQTPIVVNGSITGTGLGRTAPAGVTGTGPAGNNSGFGAGGGAGGSSNTTAAAGGNGGARPMFELGPTSTGGGGTAASVSNNCTGTCNGTNLSNLIPLCSANVLLAGASGGDGGGDGTNIGGAGGTGGGVVKVWAPSIVITASGSMTANGAAGGNGSAGNAGPGGGGGGGAVVTCTGFFESSGTNTANGGGPGTASGTGFTGGTGGNGIVQNNQGFNW